ncbi:hypothetical protein ES707_22583 [subsurface metagenome]
MLEKPLKKPLKLSKKNKIAIIILLILTVPLSIIGIIAFAPFDISNLYIRGNDVIRNFSLDSFDGEPLTSGGTVPSLGTRFNVETGGYWIIGEDDITVLTTYVSVDKTEVEIRYSIIAKNRINLYTNVRLEDATSKNLDTVPNEFLAGKFVYYGIFGTRPADVRGAWERHITWIHYDFGSDWRSWNNRENAFSGDLKASFDISPSPLPPFFEDEEGNTINTIYDYIGVYAVVVSDSTHGLMSTDKPKFNTTTPAEYDKEEKNDMDEEEPGSIPGNLDNLWNPRPGFPDGVEHEAFDIGILPHTKGASCNPTTKDGSPIFDPSDPYKNTEDCKFTYSLRSLSPLITRYYSTLTWYEQDLEIQDAWGGGLQVNHDEEHIESETRDVALHVNNRYIQAEIQVEFDVWSKFDITALKLNETQLEVPEEYYDELLWGLIVDGWGGGRTFVEAPFGLNLTELLTLIIIIVFVIVGIFLFVQFGIPLILRKQATKMVMGR